jgi:hypothetical protein
MPEAYNGDKWVYHDYDDCTRTHYVETMDRKGDLLPVIKQRVEYIETHYNVKVLVIHSDSEQILGKEWDIFRKEKNIDWEPSVPYTQEQNGSAERSGGLLTAVARSTRIAARLPKDLWPLMYKHAETILNWTPTTGRHRWRLEIRF